MLFQTILQLPSEAIFRTTFLVELGYLVIKEAIGQDANWICAYDIDGTHKVPLKFIVALSILPNVNIISLYLSLSFRVSKHSILSLALIQLLSSLCRYTYVYTYISNSSC